MSEDKSSGPSRPRNRPLSRQSSSDPFCIRSDRDCFPGLDKAFASEENDTSKISCCSKHYATKSNTFSSLSDREPSGVLLDDSVCSHQSSSFATGSSNSNSSLDMSIGARAALTEHLRHIARYGLDGQEEQEQEKISSDEQEEKWDRLMDGNTSVASWSTAPGQVESNDGSPGMAYLEPVVTVQEDGNESVEIVVDLNASDYFNSSRVFCLTTPEKNKNQQHGVTCRELEPERHPLFSSFEADCDTSQESGMIRMFRAAMGLGGEQPSPPQDSSFVAFAADVSRISASFDDENDFQPDDKSFQQQRDASELINESADIRDFIPPIERTSSGKFRDSCTPRKRSPLRSNFTPKRCSPKSWLRTSRDKENEMPLLGLSPIAAQAGNEAGRILRESGQHSSGAPFLDSASPIRKCRTPPYRLFADNGNASSIHASPISAAPSILSYLPSSGDKSIETTSPRLEPKSSKSNPLDLDGCSSMPSQDDIHKYRKQFRTVVPSRVFQQDQDEFPLQNDSFSAPSNDGQQDQDTSRRSLLESFEAAYKDESSR